MSYPGPIQRSHFQADLIWSDDTFKLVRCPLKHPLFKLSITRMWFVENKYSLPWVGGRAILWGRIQAQESQHPLAKDRH